MRITCVCGLMAVIAGCSQSGGLDIYFIDMVGGAATLIVTPQQESILVDSGSPLERDAGRIAHVVRDVAGLERIDHVVTTHWHVDHYGAIGLLADRIELGTFYDRGIPDETLDDPRNFPRLIAAYRQASRGRSTTVTAGDEIALARGDGLSVTLRCLMASGTPIATESGAATPNAHCDRHTPKEPDTGDNGQSLVLLLSFGPFDFFNAGDLTWNFERDLVCPTNRVGRVDLFQVVHHGLDRSNNPVLVHALQPKAAVMCNGPRKGGAPQVVATLRASPGLEDIWQLHRNRRSPLDQQPPAQRTANWDNPKGGEFVKASVAPNGRSFTLQIGTAGAPVSYRCWPD